MKIVINTDNSGFGLPVAVTSKYEARVGVKHLWRWNMPRNDPHLIALVEMLGDRTNLKIVEIPDGVEWEICENRGTEWVAEKHRTWS